MIKVAVFPGSFDPTTKGHESVILRALPLFDTIIVAVGYNSGKTGFFPLEKRIQWLKDVFSDYPSVRIDSYTGLTVDYCKKVGAQYILRGLRSSVDFEFERSIGQMNKHMYPKIETIFLLSETEHTPLNSTIVRDIIRNGGDPTPFIPDKIKLQ